VVCPFTGPLPAEEWLSRGCFRLGHASLAIEAALSRAPLEFDAPQNTSTLRTAEMIAPSTSSNSSAQPNYRTGDERLIKVTPVAAKKVSSLLQKQGRPGGVLRVAVVGGGCSGLQYKMDLQDQPANRDFLVESAGIKVVVDPKSALYVTGSELDYIDALQDGGFKVKNPNAASSCSCGESFIA